MRGWSESADIVLGLNFRKRVRERSVRPARGAGGRSSCRECEDRTGGCRGPAGRPTCPSWRKRVSADVAAASPSGRATVSPDWKLRSQRRSPTQVAETSCAFSAGALSSKRSSATAWALAPLPISSGRSGIWLTGTRSSTTPSRIDQRQPILVLPKRRRLALDDVDHQRVGEAARHAGVLDPAELEQPLTDSPPRRPAASRSSSGRARSHRPVADPFA